MNLEELKVSTPIWILWLDSLLNTGWHNISDLDFNIQRHEMRIRTYGFVTKVTKDAITVHLSEGVMASKKNDRLTADRIVIPRCCILRWGLVTFGPNEKVD